MWISAQSVTQYNRPDYCQDQVPSSEPVILLSGLLQGESGGASAGTTREIIKTFENILAETVLVNKIF